MTAPTILSRVDAAARHSATYFTGKPCKAGHVDRRYVSNGACVCCAKAKATAFNDVRRGRTTAVRWDAMDLHPVHPDDREAVYALVDYLNQQRGLPPVKRPDVAPVAPPVDTRTQWEVVYGFRLRTSGNHEWAVAQATREVGPEVHSPGWSWPSDAGQTQAQAAVVQQLAAPAYGGGAKPDYL